MRQWGRLEWLRRLDGLIQPMALTGHRQPVSPVTDSYRISSFRAVVSAVTIVTIRIVCERESRNLPGKCL